MNWRNFVLWIAAILLVVLLEVTAQKHRAQVDRYCAEHANDCKDEDEPFWDGYWF